METSGIYKIQSNIKSERIYIGSSININQRRDEHFRKLRSGKHCNQKLQNHFNKYGANDLVFSVIVTCEKEELIKEEQIFMYLYKPYFNICKQAYSCAGIKRSPESRERMRIANIGRKQTDDTKKKLSIIFKGKKLGMRSREHCENISIAKKGKFFLSPEHRAKLTKSVKGISLTDEHKNKISNSLKNRKLSDEHRMKISQIQIGKHLSENTKEKLRIALKGREPWNKGLAGYHKHKLSLTA